MKRLWAKADKNQNGTLSRAGVISLVAKLNAGYTPEHTLQLLEEIDVNDRTALSMDEFKVFLRRLRHRPEIEALVESLETAVREAGARPDVPLPRPSSLGAALSRLSPRLSDLGFTAPGSRRSTAGEAPSLSRGSGRGAFFQDAAEPVGAR